jgi:hypothetical protein
MATDEDLRTLAMGLEGTTSQPHFDRIAFKAKRIFVTLAADGRSANLTLTPDEQAFKVMMQPAAFSVVPNAWGAQGWTRVELAALTIEDLRASLEMAWEHGRAKTARSR